MNNKKVTGINKKIAGLRWFKKDKLFWLVVGIGVVWQFTFFYFYPKQTWGDGLTEAWFLNKGLMMYRDFTNEYPPLLFLLMVPFHKLFGFSQMPTVYLSLFNSVFLFLSVSFFSFRNLRGWYRILPSLFFLFWEPLVAENHFTTMAFQDTVLFWAFIFWWLDWAKSSFSKAFWCGLLLGVAVMSTQLAIPVTLIIGISYLYRSLGRQIPLQYFLIWLGGAAVPVVSVVGWILSQGILENFLYWNWSYYFFGYSYAGSSGRGLDNILLFASIFSPLLLVAAILVKGFINRRIRSGNTDNLKMIIFWLLLLLSFPITFWFAIFHPNRFLMSLAIYALTFGLGVEGLIESKKNWRFIGIGIFAVIILLGLFSFFKVGFYRYQWGFNYPRQYNLLTAMYPNDPMVEVIDWIKRETPPNARLFAMTDNLIYIDSDRLPAISRANTNLPLIYRPLDDFKKDLKKRAPDYWIVDERNWKRFHDFGADDVTYFLQKILDCEPVVERIEYITIRKHIPGHDLCF